MANDIHKIIKSPNAKMLFSIKVLNVLKYKEHSFSYAL